MDVGVFVPGARRLQTVVEDAARPTVSTERAIDEGGSHGEPAQTEIPSAREAEAELAPMYYI